MCMFMHLIIISTVRVIVASYTIIILLMCLTSFIFSNRSSHADSSKNICVQVSDLVTIIIMIVILVDIT